MRTLWFTMLLTTVACSGPTAPEAATTFTEVGPILERRCVTCHQSGGIGSFTLDSYESAQPWAEAVATAASARTMPPFLVQGDGTCGEFRHNQWLSDDEIATLEAWADDGAPVGDDYVVTPPTLPTLSGSPVEIQTLTSRPRSWAVTVPSSTSIAASRSSCRRPSGPS